MKLSISITEEISRIKAFESWYTEMNRQNPNKYPLTLPESDSGLWSEQIAEFDPSDADVRKVLASLENNLQLNTEQEDMDGLELSKLFASLSQFQGKGIALIGEVPINPENIITKFEGNLAVKELIFTAYDISNDSGWVYVRVNYADGRYIVSPYEKRSVISNLSADNVEDTIEAIAETLSKLIN